MKTNMITRSAFLCFIILLIISVNTLWGQTSFVPADGVLSPYIIGTFDLRDTNYTKLYIINPTGEYRLVKIAFFDDNEKPLDCVADTLSPNDLWELDLRKQLKYKVLGVIKAVSYDLKTGKPAPGIVGYQLDHYYFNRSPKLKLNSYQITKTPMFSIPTEVLMKDMGYIDKACKR